MLKITVKPGQQFMVGDAVISVEQSAGGNRMSISVSGPMDTTPVLIHDGNGFVSLSEKKKIKDDKSRLT